MSNIKLHEVEKEDAGMRVDRWFSRYYPNAPFSLIQKLLRKGNIRIDGKRAKAKNHIVAGQKIKIPNSVYYNPNVEKNITEKKINEEDRKFIKSLILYQDDSVIVLNKPSGIATQGGSKVDRHIDGLLDGLEDDQGQRPKLVHRLDKDTSGILLLARNARMAKILGQSFQSRNVRKYYWSIVAPAPERSQGKIDAPLAKVAGRGGERMMQCDDGTGRYALTHYAVMEHAGNKAAWVVFWPQTGRTHQIRVHALIAGMPILGDGKYYLEDENVLSGLGGNIEKTLHLHARRLVLPHPVQGRGMIDVTAPLSPHMKKTWKYFGFNERSKIDPFEDMEV